MLYSLYHSSKYLNSPMGLCLYKKGVSLNTGYCCNILTRDAITPQTTDSKSVCGCCVAAQCRHQGEVSFKCLWLENYHSVRSSPYEWRTQQFFSSKLYFIHRLYCYKRKKASWGVSGELYSQMLSAYLRDPNRSFYSAFARHTHLYKHVLSSSSKNS